jgi:hypothetical protein
MAILYGSAERDRTMLDGVFIALGCGFFAIACLYVAGCDSL